MKKTILASVFFLFFGLAPIALAQGFVPLAPIPGLTEGATADTAGLANFFNNLYKYLIGLAAVLAVIEIIWGGLEISTKDSVSKQSDGKERITQAIFGLVLVLSPVLVFSIINPSILNLSLNLPELDTKSVTPSVQSTSCPAGQFGTPPNCTPNEGVNYTPLSSCTPSKWCFEARETNGVTTYRCYDTRSVCINSTGYEGVQVTGACRLCP